LPKCWWLSHCRQRQCMGNLEEKMKRCFQLLIY
jgi:hypothetical protein